MVEYRVMTKERKLNLAKKKYQNRTVGSKTELFVNNQWQDANIILDTITIYDSGNSGSTYDSGSSGSTYDSSSSYDGGGCDSGCSCGD